MQWKPIGVALAAAAIGAAVPITVAQADNNGNNGKGNENPPGHSVADQARSGGGPSGVLGVLQSLHPQAPGLTTALSHVPTTVPPTRTTGTETETPTTTETETTETETTTTTPTEPPTTTENETPPGQSVAEEARSGGGPSGVLGVLQSLHPQAPGLTTAQQNVPTSVPPTVTTETETETATP